jgi:hypothetical protein
MMHSKSIFAYVVTRLRLLDIKHICFVVAVLAFYSSTLQNGFCIESTLNPRIDFNMIYKPADKKICESILIEAFKDNMSLVPINELVLMVGRSFLGTSYVSNTLEQKGPEDLVINLRQLDCFTFLENAVVLARLIRAGKRTFTEYADSLREARYRQGVMNGYPSRLHYFCDWLHDNEQKGIVKNVTEDIGGIEYPGIIRFMTANAGKYPALADNDSYKQMKVVERKISRRCNYYIPKRIFRDCQDKIMDGDLIAITTGIKGLDVIHVGIAMRVGKNIHLLHASKITGKVVVSSRTLDSYLAGKRFRTGIVVGRVL